MIQRIGWALIMISWQAMFCVAACAALLFVLRDARSAVRYRMLMTGLLVIPILALCTDIASLFERWLAPSVFTVVQTASLQNSVLARASTSLGEWLVTVHWRVDSVLSWVAFAWVIGVALLSVRFIAGWFAARRLTFNAAIAPEPLSSQFSAHATSLGIKRPVRLLVSDDVQVPATLGWHQPSVLVSRDTLRSLPDERIDAILTHELSHIARGDYAANLLQIALETLLFFHPAVWWLSARIRAERENCCDDVAAAHCGDILLYAKALAQLEELRCTGARRLAVAANGGLLVARIRRLVQPRAHVGRMQRFVAGFAAVVTIAFLFVGTRAAAIAPLLAAQRLTMFLHAVDPAGEFTITLKGARVIAASMDNKPVPPERLRQTGNSIEFLNDAGTLTLAVQVDPGTGIHWTPRRARLSDTHEPLVTSH